MRTTGRPRWIVLHALVALSVVAAVSPAPGSTDEACSAAPLAAVADERLGVAEIRRRERSAVLTAVVVHRTAPDSAAVTRLRTLGLRVQPLAHLPLSILQGSVGQLVAAADVPGVRDIHPDQPLQFHSGRSTAAIGADRVREELGVTGAGVGVAIVDSGLDATHPAFGDRVRRNVRIVGSSYLPPGVSHLPPRIVDDTDAIFVEVHEGPYSNTDTGGHGTHVAGIVAADVPPADGGEDGDSAVGVAPGAHLVGYAVGGATGATVATAVTAFDDILENQEALGIRVVNNSWGERFRLFDPLDPINVATRALHDAGLVVTFAAGNGGEEMTLNPYATAPWVIGVGSGSLDGHPSRKASAGLRYDNAGDTTSAPSHRRSTGDVLGIYHPDLIAPGERILSTATPTGVATGSRVHPPGGTTVASGSSMASPHVAGVAALLLQARPGLTPAEVSQVLEATADPVPGQSIWRAGYGAIDALAAVRTVLDPAFDLDDLRALHDDRTAELLGRRDRPAVVSDHWGLPVDDVSVQGSQRRCLAFTVGEETRAVRASVSFAPTLDGGRNDFEWALELRDAAGMLLGRSTPHKRVGVASLAVDLAELEAPPAYGTWTVAVSGVLAAHASPLAGQEELAVVVTQLGAPAEDAPAQDTLELPLVPGTAEVPALVSPEGCGYLVPGTAGALGGTPAAGCRVTSPGVVWRDRVAPSEFTSEPFAGDVSLSGGAALVLHLADETHRAWDGQLGSRLLASLEMHPADGSGPHVLATLEEPALLGAEAIRGVYPLALEATRVPTGARLRLVVTVTGAHASTVRLLHGDGFDSGLSLAVLTELDSCPLHHPIPEGATKCERRSSPPRRSPCSRSRCSPPAPTTSSS